MKSQALIVEILGTFIFLSIILSAVAESSYGPIAIAVGLLAAIYFGGKISGGHYNPAVSIMMLFKGNISLSTAIGYIIAQITGGLLALLVNSYLIL
jgi:aquaporin Z|uniref:Major intrinsic protein n=1 Tax=viral metagenome TaxID=1070528 RepID=A0A6C0LHM0_9ZZZZ